MMKMHYPLAIVTIGLSLAVGMSSSSAWADEPTAGTQAAGALTEQARDLHLEGVEHFQKGEYEACYAAFVAAWKIIQHHEIAGAMSACELKLGKHRDAAEHLQFYLQNFPESSTAEERAKTEALFREATAEVVQLTVQTVPDSAVVAVNGKVIALGKLGFYDPGTLTIDETL